MTFFQCVNPGSSSTKCVKIVQDERSRLSSSDEEVSFVLPPETDEDSDDDLSVEDGSSHNSYPGNQTNNITVNNTTGRTTLVINNRESHSTTQGFAPKHPMILRQLLQYSLPISSTQ